MIQFHKIMGQPTNQEPNQEHMWFTGEGAMFVTDNAGHPIQIGMGYKSVTVIPSGTPASAGLLRYCTANRKYYFSTEREWIELLTQGQPGSSSGPGYAGGVLLADVNNYFTSGDVEGALLEIATAINPLLGDKNLKDFTGDVFQNDEPGEWRLVDPATNMPPGISKPAWLYQRKDADGNVYGYVIGKDGDAFIRHGDNYTKISTGGDLADMSQVIQDMRNTINGMRIKVGPGLAITNGGLVKDNPTISFADGGGLDFVKKTGDTMTGTLNINGAGELKMFSNGTAKFSMQSNLIDSRLFQFQVRGSEFKLSDQSTAISPVRWDAETKKLFLNELDGTMLNSTQIRNEANWGEGILAKGPLQIENYSIGRTPYESHPSKFALYVDNAKANIAIFRSADAALAIRNQDTAVRLESITPENDGSKNMIISGWHASEMSTFKVVAAHSRMSGSLFVGNKLSIGASHSDKYGIVDTENKIMLYPRKVKSDMALNEARRHAVQIGYQQNVDTLEIIGYKTGESTTTSTWTEVATSVSATKFVSRSSEIYKKNIEKFEEDALKIVEDTPVFTYAFKADQEEKTNVGFIIERGVPEYAVEPGGKAIDTYAMVATLWQAVQELSAEVKALKGN